MCVFIPYSQNKSQYNGCRQHYTHGYYLEQRITVSDVGGGRGAEVHGVRRLVPSETLKSDTMPIVWSGPYHGFHDGIPLLHAWD